jgi:hypothetical protein
METSAINLEDVSLKVLAAATIEISHEEVAEKPSRKSSSSSSSSSSDHGEQKTNALEELID